jgi:hypothetical protein
MSYFAQLPSTCEAVSSWVNQSVGVAIGGSAARALAKAVLDLRIDGAVMSALLNTNRLVDVVEVDGLSGRESARVRKMWSKDYPDSLKYTSLEGLRPEPSTTTPTPSSERAPPRGQEPAQQAPFRNHEVVHQQLPPRVADPPTGYSEWQVDHLVFCHPPRLRFRSLRGSCPPSRPLLTAARSALSWPSNYTRSCPSPLPVG